MRFSVLIEFFSALRFLRDFFYGFAVSNRPQCPPLLINTSKFFKDNKVAFEKLASAYHTKLQEDHVLTC